MFSKLTFLNILATMGKVVSVKILLNSEEKNKSGAIIAVIPPNANQSIMIFVNSALPVGTPASIILKAGRDFYICGSCFQFTPVFINPRLEPVALKPKYF